MSSRDPGPVRPSAWHRCDSLVVVDTARRAGVARVEVTANDHASAFYDAAGFVQVGMVELLFGPVPRKHLAVATETQSRGTIL